MMPLWRNSVIALAAALVAPALAVAQTPATIPATPAPLAFAPIETIVNDAIAHNELPGAVVVIGHGGQIVFHRAYGMRSLEPTREEMTEDTIFDMASLTKDLVTATAVMQLYERARSVSTTPSLTTSASSARTASRTSPFASASPTTPALRPTSISPGPGMAAKRGSAASSNPHRLRLRRRVPL